MNTILFAVRHGETEWNLAERQQGHLDSPLTENGIKQAKLLDDDGLKEKNIDVLYSSDLGRALQTAEIIAQRLSMNYLDASIEVVHFLYQYSSGRPLWSSQKRSR